MSAEQIQEDLRFVRAAVERREKPPLQANGVYYYWAAYVLVGYFLIDAAPAAANWWFLVGMFPGFAISAIFGRRAMMRSGESDPQVGRRYALHWMGGVILAVVSSVVLANVLGLRGQAGGQLCVAMIGMVYFLAGVHFNRAFIVLGLVMLAGAAVVGYVPHYGWTMLGVVIAAGLVVPTFFTKKSAVEMR
jgi:hypothetical protein